MFLWDKKNKDNMWLISAAVDTDVNLKTLTKYLKLKNGNLRFCEDAALKKFLGCKKGNTNLFAMINDKDKAVKVLLD
jgi:hypothetical protein